MILYVYARQGKVQCLTSDELRASKSSLWADGWKHTATINPARWIESLCMGHGDPSDMIDDLQIPKPPQKP
jgi:hypothetical protein